LSQKVDEHLCSFLVLALELELNEFSHLDISILGAFSATFHACDLVSFLVSLVDERAVDSKAPVLHGGTDDTA